jgi:hypothetical protein
LPQLGNETTQGGRNSNMTGMNDEENLSGVDDYGGNTIADEK